MSLIVHLACNPKYASHIFVRREFVRTRFYSYEYCYHADYSLLVSWPNLRIEDFHIWPCNLVEGHRKEPINPRYRYLDRVKWNSRWKCFHREAVQSPAWDAIEKSLDPGKQFDDVHHASVSLETIEAAWATLEPRKFIFRNLRPRTLPPTPPPAPPTSQSFTS